MIITLSIVTGILLAYSVLATCVAVWYCREASFLRRTRKEERYDVRHADDILFDQGGEEEYAVSENFSDTQDIKI